MDEQKKVMKDLLFSSTYIVATKSSENLLLRSGDYFVIIDSGRILQCFQIM